MTADDNNDLTDHLRPAGIRAGITKQIGFHTLRHSYITTMIDHGVNVRLVQAQVGHSNPNTTLAIYTHVTESAIKNAQSQLEVLYHGQSSEDVGCDLTQFS